MSEPLDEHGLPPIDRQPDPNQCLVVTEMYPGFGDYFHDLPTGRTVSSGPVFTFNGENMGYWSQISLVIPHGRGVLTQMRDHLTAYLQEHPE